MCITFGFSVVEEGGLYPHDVIALPSCTKRLERTLYNPLNHIIYNTLRCIRKKKKNATRLVLSLMTFSPITISKSRPKFMYLNG